MRAKYPWKKEYTKKPYVPNRPGIYRLYNRNGTLIYVGHASKLRHRIQSYHERDDFKAHPTKRQVRNKIASYSYSTMPEKKARKIEKQVKKNAKFNFL
jgi:excinuclease ABC subunit C